MWGYGNRKEPKGGEGKGEGRREGRNEEGKKEGSM